MSGPDNDENKIGKLLTALSAAARAEGIAVPQDGFRGFFGLSEEMRLLLALLVRAERGPAAHEDPAEPLRAEVTEAAVFSAPDPRPDDEAEVVLSEAPTEDEVSLPASTADHGAPPLHERGDGGEMAALSADTETASGPTSPAPADAAADLERPETAPEAETMRLASPAPDASEARHGEDVPDEAVQERATPDPVAAQDADASVGQQNLTKPLVGDLSQSPQPGGVPTIPTRASSQEDGAVTPLETMRKTVHLRNARVNEPYAGAVEVVGIRSLRLEEDGGTGLRLDEETGALTGAPTASGDFVLRLQGLLAGRRCDVIANLAVIPDPKSLWVSKDSERTAPFWKPDEDTGASHGDLVLVAASKRGRSHAREGLFRDDDFHLWTGGANGWHIAVVADGAGSAKFSRRGSKIAVDTVVKDLPRLLDDHVTVQMEELMAASRAGAKGAEDRIRHQLYLSIVAAAFNAAKNIADEAATIPAPASAFSTTLVLSVARKGPLGWFVAGFAIGDGGVAILDLPNRKVVPLSLADSGEFAGQTRFLQLAEFGDPGEVMKRLKFDIRDDFTAILAMTDGITDPKFPTDVAFENPDVWEDFWTNDLSKEVRLSRDNLELERELLAWLDFWSPGNHDDRTLAIMLP
jgi:serine/threonine protein phosphatase PrpC